MSYIQTLIERTLYHTVMDRLVDAGYTPDTRDEARYTNDDTGKLYYNQDLAAIKSAKGFYIELFGFGNNQSKGNKKVPRMVFGNSSFVPGSIGRDSTVSYIPSDTNADYFDTKTFNAQRSTDFDFSIYLVSNRQTQARVLNELLFSALPVKGYLPIKDVADSRFFLDFTGTFNTPDLEKGLMETVLNFTVGDIYLIEESINLEAVHKLIDIDLITKVTNKNILEEGYLGVKLNSAELTNSSQPELILDTPPSNYPAPLQAEFITWRDNVFFLNNSITIPNEVILNDLVRDLKDAGIWAKADHISVPGMKQEYLPNGSDRLNLAGAPLKGSIGDYTMVLVNSSHWLQKQGWKATLGGLQDNHSWHVNASLYDGNEASMVQWLTVACDSNSTTGILRSIESFEPVPERTKAKMSTSGPSVLNVEIPNLTFNTQQTGLIAISRYIDGGVNYKAIKYEGGTVSSPISIPAPDRSTGPQTLRYTPFYDTDSPPPTTGVVGFEYFGANLSSGDLALLDIALTRYFNELSQI